MTLSLKATLQFHLHLPLSLCGLGGATALAQRLAGAAGRLPGARRQQGRPAAAARGAHRLRAHLRQEKRALGAHRRALVEGLRLLRARGIR